MSIGPPSGSDYLYVVGSDAHEALVELLASGTATKRINFPAASRDALVAWLNSRLDRTASWKTFWDLLDATLPNNPLVKVAPDQIRLFSAAVLLGYIQGVDNDTPIPNGDGMKLGEVLTRPKNADGRHLTVRERSGLAFATHGVVRKAYLHCLTEPKLPEDVGRTGSDVRAIAQALAEALEKKVTQPQSEWAPITSSTTGNLRPLDHKVPSGRTASCESSAHENPSRVSMTETPVPFAVEAEKASTIDQLAGTTTEATHQPDADTESGEQLAPIDAPGLHAPSQRKHSPLTAKVFMGALSRRASFIVEKHPSNNKSSRREDEIPRARTSWKKAVAVFVVASAILVGIGMSGFDFHTLGNTSQGEIAEPPTGGNPHKITPAAWGPTDRDIVSTNARNSTITLNSMVDNPVQGDERNFMQIRPADASNEEYTDEIVIEPGKEYVGFVYFKNDAIEDAANATAFNTRLKLEVPGVVHGSANAAARLSADNAKPREVWDGVTLVLQDPTMDAALRYVDGSATLHTQGAANGVAIGDELFGPNGALLGCDSLDGQLPSRDACGGYVTFRIRVDQPAFEIDASARVKGTANPYAGQVAASVGDVLEVRVSYRNVGTTQQDNVSLRVPNLPSGVRYINESSQIANSTTEGQYTRTVDGVAATGFNLGSYQPSGNVFFKFDLILDESLMSDGAGSRWLEMPSFARVTTSSGYIETPLTLTLLRQDEPVRNANSVLDPGYWRAHAGPSREMFSYLDGGAPYPVLNGLTDNPNIGDERNFVGLRLDAPTETEHIWFDHVWAKPGETYVMRAYVNNGGSDLNNTFDAGKLQDLRLRVGMSSSNTGTEVSVFGTLNAAQLPSPIWDGATLHFDKGVSVAFDTEYGAKVENNAHPDGGFRLGPEAFSSEGALIGYEEMDGVLPAGFSFAAYITFRIKITAGFEVTEASSVSTWGPQREVYSIESGGAPYPVFNSILDNRDYGDERNFFTAKLGMSQTAGGWMDDVWLNPGERLYLRVYGENSGQDAAASIPAGWLHNSRVKLSIASDRGTHIIRAELTAANAETIWDTVTVHTAPGVRLDIEQDDFEITSRAHPKGVDLAGNVISSAGAALGYVRQDGIIKPGYEYSFYVTGTAIAEQ